MELAFQEEVARLAHMYVPGELYGADHQGACGNEECDQMGFFVPGTDMTEIGPCFDKCNGVVFVYVKTLNNYASAVLYNGDLYEVYTRNIGREIYDGD